MARKLVLLYWLCFGGWVVVVVFAELMIAAAIGGEEEVPAAVSVTYDGRSVIIDGQPKLLFSGSIHYPRSTPHMWPSLISKAKEGGLDVIETYVFWNLHETSPGQYDFSGRKDIVRFIKEMKAQGLYAFIRIGPYIEAEWNYGGLPFWLHDVPGIVFRSDNEPFKYYMQNFTTAIVDMFKAERLYASQGEGGPIILSQIENEYQNIEKSFQEKGPPYVRWVAAMAVGLHTGVPWVMCKQDDAPDPVINTCNGRKCGETFVGPNSPNKPAIWTENWTSFYQAYGDVTPLRSAEDIAFHVALFIAKKNGSFINYYMYHGGTNFGRTASAFIITSYYDEAPLDEYGLINQPKWGHLRELHATLKSCSQLLLSGLPSNISLGDQQEGVVFELGGNSTRISSSSSSGGGGGCLAFLVNHDNRNKATVVFRNSSYELPPTSISILSDCTTLSFNTAQLSTSSSGGGSRRRSYEAMTMSKFEYQWMEYKETIPVVENTLIRADALLEQMNTTKDVSDYLWYTISVDEDSWSAGADEIALSIQSLGHALHAFVNGIPVGSAHGRHKNTSFTLESIIQLDKGSTAGRNINISLLSVMVGLPDSGAYLERRGAGINRVTIQNKDYSNTSWGYQVGLLGERLQIYRVDGGEELGGNTNSVRWNNISNSSQPQPQPLTWYKSWFDGPEMNDSRPLAINLKSMGKGQVWVNGESIGRYWVSFPTPTASPSQTWYHIPRSFVKRWGNQLVLFEEESRNPLAVSIDTVVVTVTIPAPSNFSYFFEEEASQPHGFIS